MVLQIQEPILYIFDTFDGVIYAGTMKQPLQVFLHFGDHQWHTFQFQKCTSECLSSCFL